MGLLKKISKLMQRVKNPISLPEDIGKDLGIQILYNELTFQDCIDKLTSKSCYSKYLKKFMPRDEVELLFKSAVRKELFKDNSIFSYYIFDGWLAFKLLYDEQNRLRRVYLQHCHLQEEESLEGVEMALAQ